MPGPGRDDRRANRASGHRPQEIHTGVAAGATRGYHVAVSPTRRIALTAAFYAAALVILGIAAATHNPYPLFVAWIPLLAVPWVVTRPG